MTAGAPTTKLGYAEYCLFPNDGNRHEVINGRHYMNPAPSPDHQTVSKHLQYFLYTLVELGRLGKVFNAPIDVQLGEFDIVQPDLVVLLNASKAVITKTRIKGPPELVVEILSPSSSKHDAKLKRQLYEQSGVREYWIVDPKRECVDQLVLQSGTYTSRRVSGKKLSPSILPKLSIPLSEIWSR